MKKRMQALALALFLCLALLSATALAADSDFTIQNGVLTKYRGPGGDVVIPAAVTAIRDAAFYECTGLTSITIPDGVTAIGGLAFQGCTGLKSAVIGNGVTKIDRQTFYGCTGLERITIGSRVTTIETMAFERCTSLKSVVFPNSVTYIEDSAFYGCTSLTQVAIPDGTVVHDQAFGGCTGLPEDALSGKVPSYDGLWEKAVQTGDFLINDGVLLQYTGTGGDVVIPNGVTYIYSSAFSNCAGLKSVTIPDSTVKVGRYAFSGCPALTRIIFPAADKAAESLKYISSYTLFTECPALTELVNCPIPAFNESLAANQARIAALDTPSAYVTAQSERMTALSNQICAGLTDDYQKAKAVYDWTAANIEYDYDYYEGRKTTVTTSPEEVLNSKLTVCDGYAQLTQALLRAQGIPALYVSGVSTITQEGHAWNVAFADGRWIYIDATWGRQGRRDANGVIISHEYKYDPAWFDPTPVYVALSHKADVPSGGAGDAPATAGGFTDVPAGEYYADPVAWAVKNGVTSGTTATTFSPEDTCTTAQILTFLWRANGAPEPAIKNPFGDVAERDYYAKAALWAHEKGLVSGAIFGADAPCTRSVTVTYLWKLAGSPAAGESGFSDVPGNGVYAQAVAWAVGEGITGGTGPTTFSPQTTCTRGQIVTFLYRAFSAV